MQDKPGALRKTGIHVSWKCVTYTVHVKANVYFILL